MRILPCLLLLAASLHGQENDEGDLLSAKGKQMFQTEERTAGQAATNQITTGAIQQQKQAATVASSSGTSSVMIVDPKVIADDWVSAFNSLKAKKILGITFVIQDGTTIDNAETLEPLPGGYLILFTLKTVQGYQYQIVKTSTITTIVSK